MNGKQAKFLWAVHISGPDDVIAMISKEEAVRIADSINEGLPEDTCVEATVILWPFDEIGHKRSLSENSD